MKKVCSLKKKLVAFGLAVCTFVTSIGVNECAAAGNAAQQNQNQQEGWSACDVIKATATSIAAIGVEVAACSYPEYAKIIVSKIWNILWFAIRHYKISSGIALAIIIGIMINKLKNFPKTLTDGVKEVKSKRKKLDAEKKKLDAEKKKLEEDMQKLEEKLAKNNKESWNTLGEELTLLPKKLVTAGATVASGAWTCATIGAKLAAFIAKGTFYSTKGLYNLTYWLSD